LLICTTIIFIQNSHAQSADDIVGHWLVEKEDGIVQITKNGDLYIGHLVWIKDIADKKVQELFDDKNPDASKRQKSLQGLKLLENFRYQGGIWSGGSIYDPESGKTYQAKMELDKKGKLQLRGFVGIPLFGRTSVWTKTGPRNY
jgi:uncharacterized protein (DUF2147 family)